MNDPLALLSEGFIRVVTRKSDMPARTHGYSRTKIYRIWTSMKSRCYCKTDTNYHHYGERGITVCERWRDDFLAFLDDMGEPPSPSHSLDRIDNEGNYELNNCRWATKSEQVANRRYLGRVIPSHPMKRIYVAPNGKYYVVLDIKGKRINKTFATLEEAQAFRDEHL